MEDNLSQIIKIDRTKKEPIYLQIVYQFINAVKQGQLIEGNPILGSRQLAKELGIHRRTMVAALDELRDQDWVEIIPNIGAYIKNPELSSTKIRGGKQKSITNNIPFLPNTILDLPQENTPFTSYFTDGQADYSVIQKDELARFYSSVLKRKNTINKNQQEAHSDFFHLQLCNYLNTTRNFQLQKNNLITTSSREMLLNIVAQILIKPKDLVLVAAYNYFIANMTFRQSQANIHTIPMDEEGLDVNFLRQNYQKGEIRLLYLQSKSQYPTTQHLNFTNRKALLQLAKEYEFILVEDDHDCEISFDKNQNFSLYKENKESWVIYLGSVGRFLTPGFQSYFLLAPDNFIVEAQKYSTIFGNSDYYKEQAVGEMIAEGDLHRYRRKVLKIYREKRNLFAQLLQNHFQDSIHFEIPKGGLAFWIEIKNHVSLLQWADNCNKENLYLPKHCLYQNRNKTAMRLGFAHLTEEEMKNSLKKLKLAMPQSN